MDHPVFAEPRVVSAGGGEREDDLVPACAPPQDCDERRGQRLRPLGVGGIEGPGRGLAPAAALQHAAEVERLQERPLHGGHHAARPTPLLHQAEPVKFSDGFVNFMTSIFLSRAE